jgi:hypothetical protein
VNSLSTRAWKVPAAECNPNGMRLNCNCQARPAIEKAVKGLLSFSKGISQYALRMSKLDKYFAFPQVIKYMEDVGERITHPLKPGVHSAEVDNKPVRTVLLRHHEIRRVLLRLGPLNDILPQHFVDLLVDEALNKGADAVVSRP